MNSTQNPSESAPLSNASSQDRMVTFPYGLPGFEQLTKFQIKSSTDYEPFCLFESQEQPDVSMIIADPDVIHLDMTQYLSSEALKQLNITSDSELKLYLIFCFNLEKKRITANLKAPIVINSTLNTGQQVILDNPELKVNHCIVGDKISQ
jgi:flagellar assembly factor FliW